MSKTDWIIATNSRAFQSRRKTGIVNTRARTLLLTLTVLLMLWIFYTQPQIRDAAGSLLQRVPGL